MTTKDCGDNTFVKVTNRDIYNKLCAVEEHVIFTNGKVKFNTKMIWLIGGGLVMLAGWVFAIALS